MSFSKKNNLIRVSSMTNIEDKSKKLLIYIKVKVYLL